MATYNDQAFQERYYCLECDKRISWQEVLLLNARCEACFARISETGEYGDDGDDWDEYEEYYDHESRARMFDPGYIPLDDYLGE